MDDHHKCRELFEKLSEYIDNELDSANCDAIEAHLQNCPPCQSCLATLKQTVALQVEQTPDGRTHDELQHLLRVRVHNTLLDLLRQGRIGRERLARVYLYVSADPTRAAAQVSLLQASQGVLRAGQHGFLAEPGRVCPITVN